MTLLGRSAITTDELRAFRRWKRDARNAAAFAEIERTFGKVEALRNDPEIARATATILNKPRPDLSLRAMTRHRPLLAASICVLVLVVAAVTWRFVGVETYTAGIGEQRRVELADGSRLTLDADSAATVRITRRVRKIQLERGRALFDVAHDPSRLFKVLANGTETRALGTRFAVSSRDGRVAVTLVQGSVEVRTQQDDSAGPARLAPGQQFVAGGRRQRPTIVAADVEAATGWTEGRLTFRNTPLKEAVEEANRYSRRKVVLAVPEFAERPVSGFFHAGDTASFANGVAELFDLTTRTTEDGSIVLTR